MTKHSLHGHTRSKKKGRCKILVRGQGGYIGIATTQCQERSGFRWKMVMFFCRRIFPASRLFHARHHAKGSTSAGSPTLRSSPDAPLGLVLFRNYYFPSLFVANIIIPSIPSKKAAVRRNDLIAAAQQRINKSTALSFRPRQQPVQVSQVSQVSTPPRLDLGDTLGVSLQQPLYCNPPPHNCCDECGHSFKTGRQ